MIRSTFAGFNTAVLGLSASQRAIDVTGQNLSNINTQGYTRQRLDQVSISPVGPSLANSQFATKVGQGVMMTGVSQIRDPFLDIQYRNQLPKVGTADAMDAVLAQIGQIFDETDKDAIAVQFEKIVSALQNLGDPQNTGTNSADTVVRSAFEVLLNTVHQNGNKVQDLYNELKTKLDQTIVPEINTYLRDIAEKNVAIKNTQVLGNAGLELMDSRNEMIDALATYFPIEVQYEKQNLGGGIIVDILNIDLKLSDGSKVRLVADDKYGEVGIARWQEDGTVGGIDHKKGEIIEPVDMYFKTAEDNPTTRGGGLETLKQELPNEINSYIDDIVELNNAIKNMRDKIATLQTDISTTAGKVADDKAALANKYITDIGTFNDKISAAAAEITTLNQKIKDSDDKIKAKRDEIKAAATAADKEKLRAELKSLQEDNAKLHTELAVKTNERNLAESQRKQTLSDLKNYFPTGSIKESIDADDNKFMTVSIEVPGNPNPTTVQLVGKNGTGGSTTGTVTANKPVTTDPEAAVSWTVTGGGNTGTISAGNKVNTAVDNAIADMKKQIETFEGQIPRYQKQRDEKVEGLKTYFPDGVTPSASTDDIMSVKVKLSDGTEVELVSNANKAGKVDGFTGQDTNSLNMSITGADGTTKAAPFEVQGVIDRITGSINDKLSEGVLKGDLDMLNKAEVFDAVNGEEATDTKGIQYYQKMLDAFVNKLATEMNRLNAITEEKPIFEADGTTPVYEVDKDGNQILEPVLDAKGQPVMEPMFEADGTTPVMETIKKTVLQEKLEEKKFVHDDGTEYTYYEKVLDENGNPVLEEVEIEVEQQKMQQKMQPKQKTETVVKEEQPLFETTDGSTIFTATNIKISDKWMNNEIKINTKRDNAGEGNSSDNWNVQKMINVISDGKFDFMVDPNDPASAKAFTGTLYECYTNIQRVQSIERQATSQILDTHTQVLDQIADNKDSISGVWMDEEVMNLMKYSQSYNAASRLMTVMDEVLERLITQTGVCGR